MDTRPCAGCQKGAPYDGPFDPERQCHYCWSFENNPRYKALWTGQPIPARSPQKEAPRAIDPECVKRNNRAAWVEALQPTFGGAVAVHGQGFPEPPGGPGTELKKLLEELGITEIGCSTCSGHAATMDAWGPGGCLEHRDEIIEWLKGNASKVTLTQRALVMAKALLKGFTSMDGLVDEAIRRARPSA